MDVNGESVRHSITVEAPQERAFYAFAQQMTSWWPRQYTQSESDFGHIVLEPEQGARWYEVNAKGVEQPDWGRLLVWDPPSRLVLSWVTSTPREANADPTEAGEIEVRFSEESPGQTRVDVGHRGIARYRNEDEPEALPGDQGWYEILSSYSEYLYQQVRKYREVT